MGGGGGRGKGDSRANLDTLEQLVHLLVRHLLAELREHVAQLADADEAVAFFVEYLEAADELLCGSGVSESCRWREKESVTHLVCRLV